MGGDSAWLRKLWQGGLLVLVSVGIPTAAVGRSAQLREHPLLACCLLLLYEAVIAGAAFVGAVARDLRERWVKRAADYLDLWTRRRLSPYTRRLLKYVRASTRYMDVKGLSTAGEYTLEMQDVLVSLSLVPTPVHVLTPDPVRQHAADGAGGEQSVWYWLRRARREGTVLSVIGPPGSGKTTLLRHVAFRLATGGRPARSTGLPGVIPLLVNLREHQRWFAEGAGTLPELLRRCLAQLEQAEPPSWVESNLRAGNVLLLLDGLDELPDDAMRASVADWIEEQSAAWSGNQFVLTSRPFGYRSRPLAGATVVEVQPLSTRQITLFAEQWYRAIAIRSHGADNDSSRLAARVGAAELLSRLEENPGLYELTANPLLLTMVANVHHYRGALPGSRTELYAEICEVFLGKRHEARGVTVDMPGRRKRAVLRALAHTMMCRGLAELPEAGAVQVIGPGLARVADAVEPADFLRSVEGSSGLLVEKEHGIYAFAHLTLQEYLAAEHIREEQLQGQLLERLDQPWWRETVHLYCAMSDATAIVDACLDRADDPAMLALAAQCIAESQQVAEESRDAVARLMSPADARGNPAGRRVAAQARLRLRAAQDIAIGRNSFVGLPVTWLEYQYFLDTRPEDGECLVPDHWDDRVYPPGQDDEPAVGLRFEDVARFCEWLTVQAGSGSWYRPPRSSEIDAVLERDVPGFSRHAFWTGTRSSRQEDGRFWPLYRQSSARAPRAAYPPVSLPADKLTAVQAASVREFAAAGSGPALLDLAQRTGASELCDIGALVPDVALAAELARERWNVDASDTTAQRLRGELSHLLDDLAGRVDACFDRRGWAERRTPQAVARREGCRIDVLRAAQLCTELYTAVTGKERLPPKHRMPRPTRKTPLPSRSPAVVVSVLAHALAEIHHEMLAVEVRLRGEALPTEAFVYRRGVGSDGRDRDSAPVAAPSGGGRVWPVLKPWADRCAAGLLLALLALPLLVIACVVRADSAGPAFFRQTRVGLNGHPFAIFKFRTMVVDAERMLAELAATNSNDSGLLFKIRQDPRVTRVGAFLRRSSLDEIPTLFNVLRGEMSMVGPRPALPEEVEGYNSDMLRRLVVKPGVTGLWQISGRSDLPFAEAMRLDLEYVDHHSARLDLVILARSLRAVVSGQGAY
ncbi:sugar transferase [Streptomyces sp. NPDC048291]|uniref:sugar transferase n=1 Tax=Streptomyces sp. NPDC048291 TaxID=3365530 RepID=UPI0037162F6C